MSVTAATPQPGANEVNVLIADDSLVIRGTIARILKTVPGVRVVATVQNGQAAVDRVKAGGIDVVVLDIEMPVMDGLTALPLLLKAEPGLSVIMASTLTTRNADISLQAINLGAADYVPKPTSATDIFTTEDFRRELSEKVLHLGSRKKKIIITAAAPAPAVQLATVKRGLTKPRVLAIGSSTGGPAALIKLFKALPKTINVPVVVTQHMPPAFTAILAQNLQRDSGWTAKEAAEGDFLEPGRILVAPGDYHMLFEKNGTHVRVRLDKGPKENFCRPAVDPMLRSLVTAYGPAVASVILTGMGHDGMAGCKTVVAEGGTVVAQDEQSSVVWGMPGAVSRAGIASAILPLDKIAAEIESIVGGRAL
ncbi:MAG: chemotaxis response regulator protein-glutamate methylesterase [Rhodospirillaceae bacterium]|nr:chemotaxis response regulator protein-glutamate methylesterase [Rhodospirillaceae bacterium]